MLTELEKFQLVNQAKTTTLLSEAILACADENGLLPSSHGLSEHRAHHMADMVEKVVKHNYSPSLLTLSYGIRQQAFYLIHYKKD